MTSSGIYVQLYGLGTGLIIIIEQQNLMSSNSSLADWLSKLGITKQLNNNDILAGITVNATLAKTIQGYTIKLSGTNTASSRISNWNIIINELEKLNIHVSQQDKAKILNGDDKIVYNILYEIKQRYDKNRQEVQVDINKIDARSDPKSAKSLLELFILVIIKYYGFSIKEAVALLSNDSKYLAHILAKGFKENPKPVELMILELERLLPQISSFCKNKENETFFLKSIKPALISKFLSISELSLQLLTMFTKNAPQCYQIVRNELMPILVLCLRRHGGQLGPIIKALTEVIGYNKNLLSLFVVNGSSNEAALFMIQMINQSQDQKLTSEVIEQFTMEQFVETCIQNIRNSQLFANSATFLIKLFQHNYAQIQGNSERLSKIVDNFTSLYLSKRGDIMMYTNLLFSFLHLLGKRKNAIAPQLFKLAVDRYRNVLNEDQSHNYLFNFLQIIQVFPSIPTVGIAEAIILRYENQTTYIGQLQLDILLNSVSSIDEVLALKIYNIITKIFVEEVGGVKSISNILETIIRKFDTKMIFDLTVKFIKICLAVFYANLRKLNYSKSLIDGTIKLDRSNVFYKAKNKEIQKLLANFILIRDEKLNKTLQPLICYSYFQSEIKNKDESQGIKRVMTMLGEEEQLRNLYENDAKLLLEDVRNQGKKVAKQLNQNDRYKDKEAQSRARATSDATLLIKKKNFLYNPLNQPKVSLDAQKGLEKYNRVYLQKVGRHSLQQERKNQQSQRKQQLTKLFTMKILQKGININKQITVNCIYDFNSKEKQLLKDIANDFSYLPFYDPQNEDDRDVKALQFLMKKYARLFKVYYNNYGGKLRPNTVKLFQDISQRGNLMQTANVWRLLRDHFLDKYITVNEVQYLIQKINAQLKKQYKDSSVLDYEVFENFIIQASVSMFSRPPKDLRNYPTSEMVQQVINKLKEHAQINRIDEKLFEQNEHFQSNKAQQLKELNQKLLQNPDYILPEGYKKQTIKKLNFDYKFHLLSLNETYKDVYEILDQILSEKLGFHIIEAYSVTFVQATARPILYQTQFDYAMKGRSFSSLLPKESKPSHQLGQQGQEEEQVKENNVQSSRIENSFMKQRKLKEEERRQKFQEQQKQRVERDKQLKALLEKHRQKQQQLQKEKQQKKNEQAKRLQQEKRKREKYEQILKKKVSEFAEKKKIQKEKQQQAVKKGKQQQIKNMQKLKLDIQRKKKLVQISQEKKRYDVQLKNQMQSQQVKQKQTEKNAKLAEQKQKTKKLLEQYKQKKLKQKEQEKSKLNQSQIQTSKVNSNESALQSKLIHAKQAQNLSNSKEMNIEELDHSDN